ncbi:alkaline phosphatase family protein [Streptacidiphilus anmyonensis]|uniref:alkaline phosphatase family protein n=1 Tax=Streptacidiphilus anmyonensis TaxID=405782 RepID=UPI0005A7DF54|nr:alkaline phosphatase family protein [Streptacidiphilus anmyonensis]
MRRSAPPSPTTARRTSRPRPATLAAAALTALAAAVTPALVGPAQSASAATQSANLLLNGNAETSQCSPGGWEETTVPGWQITSGDPVVNCYGVPTGASTSTPGSPTKGTAYFQGGSRGSSEMTQATDVSSAATAIDAGGVHATLSAWLGGVSSYNDAAAVTITYRNAAGASLGTASIGPVLAADRGSTTEFLQRSTTAAVPAGTRSILTTVDFTMTGTQNDGMADDLSLTLDTPTTAPTLNVPASTVPGYDHVFVVMMENNNYSASSNTADGGAGIIGNSSAPYINNTLVPMGSLLTNYHANTHSSDPNYEAIAFGNSYGRSNNSNPGADCITNTACAATNNGLNDNLDAAGKSWKQYVQSQTSNCQTGNSGNYESDDVPFYYDPKMQSDNAYCQAHWQPLPQLLNTDLKSTSTTPAFVWADADSCNDMEGCGIAAGDTWLSQTLPTLFASPAWTQQKSLLVLTWDEDGSGGPGGFGPGQSNQVATIVIGSQGTVKAGYQDATRYDHYSTARVIEGALGLPSMTNNDKWATPYNEVFTGAQSGGNTVTVTNPGSQTATAGTAISSLQLAGSDSASGQTLSWSATGLPAGLSVSSSGAITGTPTTAGTYQVTATATDGTGASGSAGFTWTVAASGTAFQLPIANPGAETGSCGSGTGGYPAQAWTATSNLPQQVCYGAPSYPTTAQGPKAPATPGNAFFDGGPYASSQMTQTVDVSSQAAQIATGTLPYNLSGWIGGYSSQGDKAGVVATFLNASGTSLGTATLAPVTAAQRSNQTELLLEQATGTVPQGTTSVKFTVSFTRSAGTDDDGYVDDLGMTFGS